jgi:Big-like domain-containing protein
VQSGDGRLMLETALGAPFAVGVYEHAARADRQADRPGINFDPLALSGCDVDAGRFVVLDYALGVAGLDRLAADFEQHCADGRTTYGELRLNSPFPLTRDKPPGSTTPDAFMFRSRKNVGLGTVVVSDATAIFGTNAPAPIAIAGGEYSVNGGPFTSSPGFVNPRDHVQVRVNASGMPGTTVGAVLSVAELSAAFDVTTTVPGQPMSGMVFDSAFGDFIGDGQVVEMFTPDRRVNAFTVRPGVLGFNVTRVDFNPFDTAQFDLQLQAPPGSALGPGAYEDVARVVASGTSAGLALSTVGRTCSQVRGRFVVLELAAAADGTIERLAADLEQRCEDARTLLLLPPLYGEVRFNSAIPFTATKPPGSTAPDPFAFAPRDLVLLSSVVESNEVTIYGINAPAAISIIGGEYSVNGGAFTAASGFVGNRDRVRVRTTAGGSEVTTSTATLTVGGVSASFNVTTFATGQAFSAFAYRSTGAGDVVGEGATLRGVTPQWTISTRHQASMVDLKVVGPLGENYSLLFAPPADGALAPGAYENAERAPFNLTAPGISITNGRAASGCNESIGRFVVLDLDIAPDGTVNRFAANFEHRCKDAADGLAGEIRLNSAIPLTDMKPSGTTLPDPFLLKARSPVRGGEVVTSNTIHLSGVNAPVPLHIVGGEYSVNGGAFTSVDGVAQPLDEVRVRLVASQAPGAVNSATLDAGGRAALLPVITYFPGMVLNGVMFREGRFFPPGTAYAAFSPEFRLFHKEGAPGTAVVDAIAPALDDWVVRLGAAAGMPLAPGAYDAATVLGKPFLNTSGFRILCQRNLPDVGWFFVRDIAYAADGSLERLAVDLEHDCADGSDFAYVEMRMNTTEPFTYFTDAAAAPSMLSPAPGAVLTGRQQRFEWTPTRARMHFLLVGSTPGGSEYGVFPTNPVTVVTGTVDKASGTLGNSAVVSGLPADGRTLYVRLLSLYEFDDSVVEQDYTYTAVTEPTLAASTISLGASSLATTTGQPVTLTAIVTGTAGTATGTVSFLEGATVLGSAILDGAGQATTVVASFAAGTHTITATYSGDGSYAGSRSPFLSIAVATPAPPAAALVNISTRMQVLTGDDVMIAGFIIGGGASKTVAIQGIGPSLAAAGIVNFLRNPTLQLFRSSDGVVIATNDDWGSAPNAAAIQAAGFAPADRLEPAMMVTLPPGAYTAILSGVGGTTGVGLVGVYEVDHPEAPLVNISTRGIVLNGDDVMIGGFVVGGSGNQNVVITAIGPSLVTAGIPGFLPNPTLTVVRSSDGQVIATNDDWATAANASAIRASGFAPANPRESAIMMSLPPGAYTAIVSDAGGAAGVAIIAVYTTP